MSTWTSKSIQLVAIAACVGLAFGCSERRKAEGEGGAPKAATGSGSDQAPAAAAQTIKIAGSSTVSPITEAVAEEFQKKNQARVTIAVTGTGGGFKKFCRGETALTGASRPIKPTEREACKKASIGYIELPVAYDGLAVVVSKQNDWVDHMTTQELKTMWAPESAKQGIKKWSQIRTGWPDKEFHLFGPGTDSGTFDYFTKAIVGKEQASRGDFTPNEDDNVLVQGISGDKVALGYFGYAYYAENKDKLKIVPIEDGKDDNGKGPIAPSLETVANGTYQPLSRPIFVYISKKEAQRPEIEAFVKYYLSPDGRKLVKEVGYIPLPDKAYDLVIERFNKRTEGSLFEGGSKVGVTVEQLLGS
ncbi:MAG: PstS family phosphate ABC transporter substrate-binding protein [Proteobacteria bacterium]|nr:PstS family phosphate ABC transporter substrate-binding protein [Pseudomonadota bacterium]